MGGHMLIGCRFQFFNFTKAVHPYKMKLELFRHSPETCQPNWHISDHARIRANEAEKFVSSNRFETIMKPLREGTRATVLTADKRVNAGLNSPESYTR